MPNFLGDMDTPLGCVFINYLQFHSFFTKKEKGGKINALL